MDDLCASLCVTLFFDNGVIIGRSMANLMLEGQLETSGPEFDIPIFLEFHKKRPQEKPSRHIVHANKCTTDTDITTHHYACNKLRTNIDITTDHNKEAITSVFSDM